MSEGNVHHWFEEMADHMGEAYLRYSFTKGTAQEVDFLVDVLSLKPGMRILDVGCGPGRHSIEFAKRGYEVQGIDISQSFIDVAQSRGVDGTTFTRMDARSMPFVAEFDAVICLCQGAFGLMTEAGEDESVLRGIRRALRDQGRVALSAFNAYFAVKYHEEASFSAATGVSHERTEVRDSAGRPLAVDLWTGCYTPRELRLMFAGAGMDVEHIFSVEPGVYAKNEPSVESPEYLVVAFTTPFRREGAHS